MRERPPPPPLWPSGGRFFIEKKGAGPPFHRISADDSFAYGTTPAGTTHLHTGDTTTAKVRQRCFFLLKKKKTLKNTQREAKKKRKNKKEKGCDIRREMMAGIRDRSGSLNLFFFFFTIRYRILFRSHSFIRSVLRVLFRFSK